MCMKCVMLIQCDIEILLCPNMEIKLWTEAYLMYCLYSIKQTTERFIFSPILNSIFSMSMILILFWFHWIKPYCLKIFCVIKILNRRYQHVNHRKLFLRSLLHPQNIITGTWTKKHKYGQLDLNYDILCHLLHSSPHWKKIGSNEP